MAKLNFQFEQPFDEIEVNGDIYKLYYDDDSLRRYQKLVSDYKKEAEQYAKKQQNFDNMTDKEIKELEKKGIAFMEKFVDGFYGEGAFEPLYEASGYSMINFIPLIEYTLEWLDSKIPDAEQKKKDYYLKKNKK